MPKLLTCPFCGFEPDSDDADCVYPVIREQKTKSGNWQSHCV